METRWDLLFPEETRVARVLQSCHICSLQMQPGVCTSLPCSAHVLYMVCKRLSHFVSPGDCFISACLKPPSPSQWVCCIPLNGHPKAERCLTRPVPMATLKELFFLDLQLELQLVGNLRLSYLILLSYCLIPFSA